MLQIKEGSIIRGDFKLENFNIEIKANKVYAIIGKNAVGKSSLLYALSGAVYSNLSKDYNVKLAYVGEEWPYNPKKALKYLNEEVIFFDSSFDNNKYLSYLEMFNINSNHKIINLSKGEKKMVLLAVALSREINVLLLDEILLNIDQYKQAVFKNLLREFMLENNKSIVLATNQIDAFEELIDEVIYLKNHNLFYQGSIIDLKTNYQIKQINKTDISKYSNIVSKINYKYYVEILLERKNDGTSNILDIIKHLERSNYAELHI